MKYVSEGPKYAYLFIYINFPMILICLLFVFNENLHFHGILGLQTGFLENRGIKLRKV